jgi:hypothetical protein
MASRFAQASGTGVVQVVPSSALKANRGSPVVEVSIMAQVTALQVSELTPIPSGGGVALVSVSPCVSNMKRRSRPGREPPRRHWAPEQATDVNKVGVVGGRVMLNQ